MKKKTNKEVYAVGSGEMPQRLRRNLIPPKKVSSNPTAARIQELLVFHPGVVEFRADDIHDMSEKTLLILLSDIETALEIK